MDPFLAEICIFAGNFAPRGWAFCNGQLLAINQNSALFSLLGTTYGGDGRTTFALPDLRGRTPVHPGTGPGLSTYKLGARGGVETVTLTQNQMPSHTHTATVAGGSASITGTAIATVNTSDSPDSPDANDTFLANNESGNSYASAAGSTTLNARAVTIDSSGLGVNLAGLAVTNFNTGGSQYHTNLQPFLAVNYIIATMGTFPSRS